MVQQVAKVKTRIFLSGINRHSNARPQQRQSAAGFSLLEVILVLVIMGLMLGVIATSLSEGPVLRKSTREIASSLRHARSLAILRQQEVVWSMDVRNKEFWLSETESTPTERFVAQRALTENVAIVRRHLHEAIDAKLHTASTEVISAQQANIRFYPDGSSTGGSVELSFKGEQFKVNVEWISGRVSTL